VCPSLGPWLCPPDNFPDANPDPTSNRLSDRPDFHLTFSPTFISRGYCKNNDHVSLSVWIDSDIRLLKISCNYIMRSETQMSEGELE
jgi:hypothetical protein